MKSKFNGGYSLIEILIAMAVLGIVMIPATSALLTAHRMNAKAEAMLQAQLQVSSAVETLMAKGISQECNKDRTKCSDVEISAELVTDKPYYKVTVTSKEEPSVSIITYIRRGVIG